MAKINLFCAVFLMLSIYFILRTEWNHAKDLNRQPAINGALESVPGDGMVTARIQVLLTQSLKHLLFHISSAVILLI